MGVRGIERGLLAISLALLAACGGASARNDTQELPAAGGSASAAGSGGASGSTAAGSGGNDGGTAGATGPATPFIGFRLNNFPWFVHDRGTSVGTVVTAQEGVVHVELLGAPVQTTISTHHHVVVVSIADGVRFTARASRDVALRVSVTSQLKTADYFAARDAGEEWPSAPTPLTTDWATFEVPFAEMRPAETDAMSAAGFQIAFIVDEPTGPVELWLDEVYFY